MGSEMCIRDRLYFWWFEYSIPRILEKYKANIFISMDNFYSLSIKIPGILVIHDLAYLHYPEHIDKMHLYYYRKFTPLFIKKATRIATVSQYTCDDIIAQFGLKPDKVSVVGIGLNEGISEIKDQNKIDRFLISKKIDRKYFLHVGTFQPRKNVASLITAYDLFRNKSKEKILLVLTGDKGWKSDAMFDAYDASPYKADIIILGYQNNDALSMLLSGAYALFLVSLFEGFGLPIIEAQKCGCPVVTSQISSMPEASGGAALLVDPGSVDSISSAMEIISENTDRREKLIKAGYENAAKYNWETTAANFWRLIEEIIPGT